MKLAIMEELGEVARTFKKYSLARAAFPRQGHAEDDGTLDRENATEEIGDLFFVVFLHSYANSLEYRGVTDVAGFDERFKKLVEQFQADLDGATGLLDSELSDDTCSASFSYEDALICLFSVCHDIVADSNANLREFFYNLLCLCYCAGIRLEDAIKGNAIKLEERMCKG
jgi:NTP pyrophosphatase (non-canonical NTP hydrolase)